MRILISHRANSVPLVALAWVFFLFGPLAFSQENKDPAKSKTDPPPQQRGETDLAKPIFIPKSKPQVKHQDSKNNEPLYLFPDTAQPKVEQGEEVLEEPVELPRGVVQKLEDLVIPALAQDHLGVVYEVMTPMIRSLSNDQLKAVEAFVLSKGQPSVVSKYAEAKIRRIEQGVDSVGEEKNLSIALYVVRGINLRVQGFLDEFTKHKVMQDPLIVDHDWEINREVFWETHVFRNEFANNQQLIDFASQTLKILRRTIERSNDQEVKNILEQTNRLVVTFPKLKRQLIEREAELRLQRFNRALKTFATAEDFETRLVAAICIELDSAVLVPFLSNAPSAGFTRPALNKPNLAKEISDQVAAKRNSEDQVMVKAILLRSGLHSWIRGRYGMGPLAGGLLKTTQAMVSTDAMNALYMPKTRPKPISSFHSEEESSPGYDRRHFYTWGVEYRPIVASYSVTSDTSNNSSVERTPLSNYERKDFFF